MVEGKDVISKFYLSHLDGVWQENFIAACPFCKEHGYDNGRLIVFLNKDSFFHGYFRCLNRCVPGGFPLWFASLADIPLSEVPDYDPDQDIVIEQPDYPVENVNDEMRVFRERITDAVYNLFKQSGITKAALTEMGVGFNGRYMVYPYIQEDGNCYSARCVYPEKSEDYFWHGNEKFSK